MKFNNIDWNKFEGLVFMENNLTSNPQKPTDEQIPENNYIISHLKLQKIMCWGSSECKVTGKMKYNLTIGEQVLETNNRWGIEIEFNDNAKCIVTISSLDAPGIFKVPNDETRQRMLEGISGFLRSQATKVPIIL